MLDQLHARLRLKHCGIRIEQALVSLLATQRQAAACTKNQALSPLFFLYREVLTSELPWMATTLQARRPQRVPVVVSRDKASRMLTP